MHFFSTPSITNIACDCIYAHYGSHVQIVAEIIILIILILPVRKFKSYFPWLYPWVGTFKVNQISDPNGLFKRDNRTNIYIRQFHCVITN